MFRTTFTYTKWNGETRDIITDLTKNPLDHFTPKYFDGGDLSMGGIPYKTWFDLPLEVTKAVALELGEGSHTHVRVYDEVNEGWRTLICGHGEVGIKNVWNWEHVEHGAQPRDDGYSIEDLQFNIEPQSDLERQDGVNFTVPDPEPDIKDVMSELLCTASRIEGLLKSVHQESDNHGDYLRTGDVYPNS